MESLKTPENEQIKSFPRSMPVSNLPEIKTKDHTEDLFSEIGSKSVVYAFKSDLISNRDSNTTWKPKLETWKAHIKLGKKVDPFTWNKKEDPNFKNIKDRCGNAYKRESWKFESFLEKDDRRKQYWNLVWTMCAQEGKIAPSNWGG